MGCSGYFSLTYFFLEGLKFFFFENFFLEALECDTQEHSFDQRIDQSEQSADQNNECDTVTVTFILSLGCVIFVSHDSTCHMTLDDLFILGLYFGSGKESE